MLRAWELDIGTQAWATTVFNKDYAFELSAFAKEFVMKLIFGVLETLKSLEYLNSNNSCMIKWEIEINDASNLFLKLDGSSIWV